MIFYIKDGFLNRGKWVHVKYINNFLILRSSLFNYMLKGLNIIILCNYTIYTLNIFYAFSISFNSYYDKLIRYKIMGALTFVTNNSHSCLGTRNVIEIDERKSYLIKYDRIFKNKSSRILQ